MPISYQQEPNQWIDLHSLMLINSTPLACHESFPFYFLGKTFGAIIVFSSEQEPVRVCRSSYVELSLGLASVFLRVKRHPQRTRGARGCHHAALIVYPNNNTEHQFNVTAWHLSNKNRGLQGGPSMWVLSFLTYLPCFFLLLNHLTLKSVLCFIATGREAVVTTAGRKNGTFNKKSLACFTSFASF